MSRATRCIATFNCGLGMTICVPRAKPIARSESCAPAAKRQP